MKEYNQTINKDTKINENRNEDYARLKRSSIMAISMLIILIILFGTSIYFLFIKK